MRHFSTLAIVIHAACVGFSADTKAPGVKSVAGAFDPPEAKPGQTVTFRLTVTLAEGYTTYPLAQPEKAAAGMVNQIEFPKPGSVVFVGDPLDPPNPKSKAEPAVGIEELLYYSDTVVFERKAVVSPSAKPGEVSVQLPKFTLSVCDKSKCFPPVKYTPEAVLKVLDAPAVEVDKKYVAEVEKATRK